MHRLLLIVATACGSASSPPKPAPPVPLTIPSDERTCAEAAAGLERGTRDIRDPDAGSVVNAVRARCLEDHWSAAAIACFAAMTGGDHDDLGRCFGEITPAAVRERLFAALGTTFDDRTAIAMAQVRLADLKVGVAECDTFVTTVVRALGCEAMPLATRVQLGNETADFWSLPTTNLPADAQRRMAEVCGKSLGFLRQQVADAGCMP